MPKFYVPVVLVINADNDESPDGHAEMLIDALCRLNPASLDGYTLLTQSEATPASTDWFQFEQHMTFEDGHMKIEEKPMTELTRILMRRDGLTQQEAQDAVIEARGRVRAGEDPEEILYEEFGLEPDYIWELI